MSWRRLLSSKFVILSSLHSMVRAFACQPPIVLIFVCVLLLFQRLVLQTNQQHTIQQSMSTSDCAPESSSNLEKWLAKAYNSHLRVNGWGQHSDDLRARPAPTFVDCQVSHFHCCKSQVANRLAVLIETHCSGGLCRRVSNVQIRPTRQVASAPPVCLDCM